MPTAFGPIYLATKKKEINAVNWLKAVDVKTRKIFLDIKIIFVYKATWSNFHHISHI